MYNKFIKIITLFAISISAHATSTPIIMGYWENWGTYQNYPMPNNAKGETNAVLSAQLTGLTAVAYAFLEVDANGVLVFSDVWSDLNPASQKDKTFCAASPASCPNFPANAGLGNFTAFSNTNVTNHVISVGGASHDAAWESAFNHPDAFVNSLKLLVNTYQINWLDIDYEPQGGVPADKIPAFIFLVKKIHQALPSLTISYATAANQYSAEAFGAANWKTLMANINYVSIMGYDLHGVFDVGNPYTALHSALAVADANDFSDENMIAMLNRMGVPNNQIILGMPMYGRAVGGVQISGLGQTFTQSYRGDLDESNCSLQLNAGNVCSGTIQYKTLIEQEIAVQPVYVNDLLSGVYAYLPSEKVFVSFDNHQSAAAKAQFTKDNHLAGMMFWALRFDKPVTDHRSILAAVDRILNPAI